METIDTIRNEFKEAICEGVTLEPVGIDRYLVDTPFLLPGGDAVPIILERHGDRWRLTDGGEVFMQLAILAPGFHDGKRWEVIETDLAAHHLTNNEGALEMDIPDARWGQSLSSYIQGVLAIAEVRHWSREVVRQTFEEDARTLLGELDAAFIFDYRDPDRDPEGLYPVDALLRNGRDLFVMLVGNDIQCRETTITLHQWERWRHPFDSLVIFREQEGIARRPLAQLADISGKHFSSLASARERLPGWLADHRGGRRGSSS